MKKIILLFVVINILYDSSTVKGMELQNGDKNAKEDVIQSVEMVINNIYEKMDKYKTKAFKHEKKLKYQNKSINFLREELNKIGENYNVNTNNYIADLDEIKNDDTVETVKFFEEIYKIVGSLIGNLSKTQKKQPRKLKDIKAEKKLNNSVAEKIENLKKTVDIGNDNLRKSADVIKGKKEVKKNKREIKDLFNKAASKIVCKRLIETMKQVSECNRIEDDDTSDEINEAGNIDEYDVKLSVEKFLLDKFDEIKDNSQVDDYDSFLKDIKERFDEAVCIFWEIAQDNLLIIIPKAKFVLTNFLILYLWDELELSNFLKDNVYASLREGIEENMKFLKLNLGAALYKIKLSENIFSQELRRKAQLFESKAQSAKRITEDTIENLFMKYSALRYLFVKSMNLYMELTSLTGDKNAHDGSDTDN